MWRGGRKPEGSVDRKGPEVKLIQLYRASGSSSSPGKKVEHAKVLPRYQVCAKLHQSKGQITTVAAEPCTEAESHVLDVGTQAMTAGASSQRAQHHNGM